MVYQYLENDSHKEQIPKMSFVEGIRVDIYFLGIIILKLLGKMRVEEGDDQNMTYLLKIPDISLYYRNESMSEEMIDFLNLCFYDPQITLIELMMHNLISEIVATSESAKMIETHMKTVSFHDASSHRSGTTNTSKILKRYLTNGTDEGSSDENNSESTAKMLRSSISTFKSKQKIQSVLYEDSSYIIKKLLSMSKRKTTFYESPIIADSKHTLSKYTKLSSIMDSVSIASSSPSNFSRQIDRTSNRNRLFVGEEQPIIKNQPIQEETIEEEEEHISDPKKKLGKSKFI
jgi:hypothetical protein